MQSGRAVEPRAVVHDDGIIEAHIGRTAMRHGDQLAKQVVSAPAPDVRTSREPRP